jgi:hypothetical protein
MYIICIKCIYIYIMFYDILNPKQRISVVCSVEARSPQWRLARGGLSRGREAARAHGADGWGKYGFLKAKKMKHNGR